MTTINIRKGHLFYAMKELEKEAIKMSTRKGRQICINDEEKISLQTMIAMEIRNNEECKERGITTCFKTEDLKKLYQKIAGYSYERE